MAGNNRSGFPTTMLDKIVEHVAFLGEKAIPIDELGIFLVAVFSMRASKMEEKHGRILKMIRQKLFQFQLTTTKKSIQS